MGEGREDNADESVPLHEELSSAISEMVTLPLSEITPLPPYIPSSNDGNTGEDGTNHELDNLNVPVASTIEPARTTSVARNGSRHMSVSDKATLLNLLASRSKFKP
jgi:hypothetical protein